MRNRFSKSSFVLSGTVAILIAGGGCRSDGLNPNGSNAAKDMSTIAVNPGEFLFDFSGTNSGGMGVGAATNVAVAFSQSSPVRRYAFSDAFKPFRSEEGLFVTEELLSFCPASDVKPSDLPAGDVVSVAKIDLELLSTGNRQVPWTWCYGVRSKEGVWTWFRTLLPLEYDAATDRMKGTASIDVQLQASAVKVVVSTNENVYLRTLKVTSRP